MKGQLRYKYPRLLIEMPLTPKSGSTRQTQPLVSFIIPNYNKCSFIGETLESVISQEYSNWEALVIDDGSTDNSVNIIMSYVNRDARIRFYTRDRLPKSGSVCRNIGIEKSEGDYIQLLDSDDLLQPFCLLQRIEFVNKNSQLDFAVFTTGTFYKIIGDNNSLWVPRRKNHLNRFLAHNLQWNIMAPIWRRDFLIKINGFDEQFTRLQDVELHTRALLQNDVKYKIAHQHRVDCYYRIDVNRTKQSYLETLIRMLGGVTMYSAKFELLVNTTHQKNAIRGTLFSFLTQLNYYRIMAWVTVEEYTALLKEFNNFLSRSKIFNNSSRILMNIYCFLYGKGGWKLKGFNYFMKFCVKHS